jgi:hypothetical protein
VVQLVLTIVELLRRLMERQAIRRMEQKTLTRKEVEAVGEALMKLEETVRDIGAKFGLTPEELNLDLGPLGIVGCRKTEISASRVRRLGSLSLAIEARTS